MSEFAYPPSFSTSADSEPRVLEARYGGGYNQVLADGINNVLKKWSLQFHNRSWATLSGIDTFLKGKGGWQRFTWTPPEPLNSEIKVRCKRWSFTWDGGQVVGITAEFEEVAG